jgi:hypothetical protein
MKLFKLLKTQLNFFEGVMASVFASVLGVFSLYVLLFAAFSPSSYSFMLNLRFCTKLKIRAVVFLAIMLALTFIEIFVRGTIIGFFKWGCSYTVGAKKIF